MARYLNGWPTLPADASPTPLRAAGGLCAAGSRSRALVWLAEAAAGATPRGAFDGAVYPPGVAAPGFTLHDQHGQAVSLSSYRGKVWRSPSCRARADLHRRARRPTDPGRARRTRDSHRRGDDLREHEPAHRYARARSPLPRGHVADRPRRVPDRHTTEFGAGLARLPTWPFARRRWPNRCVLLIDREGIERVAFGIEQITPEGLSHDIRLLLAPDTPLPAPATDRPPAAGGSTSGA